MKGPSRGRRGVTLGAALLLVATLAPWSLGAVALRGTVSRANAENTTQIPAVLRGDTWLRHHQDDLMPYWDMPEALGEPVGNFPSFRGRAGELLPESSNRGLSTLARGVYGYSLAFMLTGEERYLTYAKAGLDWINDQAKDPVYGGYFGDLDLNGNPVNRLARKDLFDLASLGLAYGMYFNATRDPDAEAGLLAVRDLVFGKYYDAATNRFKDALTYDLTREVDTSGNGGDITDLLVPGTAMFLPNIAILTDPARRVQFRDDLRKLTQSLIDRHKNSASPTAPWWFWGRTKRFGIFGAAETDFGHNIKSYEMIYNASQMFADRPWEGLNGDRDALMERAWDEPVGRWNFRLNSFAPGDVEPDSSWWIHDEADQTLAALDLGNGFAYRDQLAKSAQTWLDVFVDRDPAYPARETFARIQRTGVNDLRKSFLGKNMLHAHEHALIMYLHGRALEGRPARLYYAFPTEQALTAVAKPYWFDASGEFRTVGRDLTDVPGHKLVEVQLTGIGQVPPEPYPAPDDTSAPVTAASMSEPPNGAGWHRNPVTLSFTSTDEKVGVKEVHVRVEERGEALPGVAFIHPGDRFTVPELTDDGVYDVTYFSVDALGNTEAPHTLRIKLDRTPPSLTGLSTAAQHIWPPNGRMVQVADVAGGDALSGVGDVSVTVNANEPLADGDVIMDQGSVKVRAVRDDEGTGRVYTLVATVSDVAGNVTTTTGTVEVPHDLRSRAHVSP